MSEATLNNATNASTNNVDGGSRQTSSDEPSLEVLPQLLPIAVVIILTNAVVFCLFCTKPSLRKAPNHLLFSLAICDFLNGSFNIPLFILIFIPVVKGPTMLTLICAVEVSHNFVAVTAACHIFLITAEKYIAVMRPLRYHVIKKKTMLFIIAAVWLSSAVVSLVPIFWFSLRFRMDPVGLTLETGFNVFCILAVFIVPYAFIIYAHVVMFFEVFKRNKQRQALTSSKTCNKKNNEKKCLIIFATLATVFALCWLPWFVLRLVYSLTAQRLITPDFVALETAAQIILISRYLTSVVNPLLYTFFKQDFWRGFKSLILKPSVKHYHYNSSTYSKPTRRSTGRIVHGNHSDSLEDPVSRRSKRYGHRRSFRAV